MFEMLDRLKYKYQRNKKCNLFILNISRSHAKGGLQQKENIIIIIIQIKIYIDNLKL